MGSSWLKVRGLGLGWLSSTPIYGLPL